MKRIRVVIFDCDGVMFDSQKANIAFYNTILRHFGRSPLSEDDVMIAHTSTAEEVINHLFRDDPLRTEAQQYRFQLNYQPFIRLMTMEPHLEEVLQSLRPRYRIALATNRTNTIRAVLGQFALQAYFDLVVSALDVARPKPHPETVFKILDHFGMSSQEALFVGDSIIDAEVAQAASVLFVAYKNPQIPAAHHIEDLREVLSLVALPDPGLEDPDSEH